MHISSHSLTPGADSPAGGSLAKAGDKGLADARRLRRGDRTNATTEPGAVDGDRTELRDAFNSFVGQTLFSQTLAAMRKTVNPPAYFHGGRAEEVFQSQLDQQLAEQLAEASSDRLADPMFELFMLGRQP